MTLLLSSAIKVCVIVAVALAATVLMRRASAAFKHWLLAAATVCAAAVPLLEVVVPAWHIDTGISTAVQRIAEPATRDLSRLQPGAPARMPEQASSNDSQPVRTVDAASLAAAIWIAGALASASLMLVGFARLHWVASRAHRIEGGRIAVFASEISREWKLRAVTLLQSSDSPLLVTWGLAAPKVLLPAAANGWTDERLRIVLRHELAHVARGDWAVQILAELVRSFYWFNPLLWMICRRLRQESEHASDDVVLARGVDAGHYAAHLLDLARTLTGPRRSWGAAPAMARSCSLERRIAAMLNTRLNRAPLAPASRIGIALASVGLTAALAGVVVAQTPSASFAASVTDPSGAPIPETTIVLTDRKSGTSHAAPTDQSGYVEFASVPAGEYTLEARAVGFALVRDAMTLAPADRVRRDMKLNIGTIQETITISGVASSSPPRPARTIDMESIREKFRGRQLRPPMKVKDVRPVYPAALWESGVEGQVRFEGRLGADGTINSLRVVGPANPELATAARDAVSQWRFEPTLLWGTPVEIGITVDVAFKAQK